MLFPFFIFLKFLTLETDVELEQQREMFDSEYDINGDGRLDGQEFKRWVAPSNE